MTLTPEEYVPRLKDLGVTENQRYCMFVNAIFFVCVIIQV